MKQNGVDPNEKWDVIDHAFKVMNKMEDDLDLPMKRRHVMSWYDQEAIFQEVELATKCFWEIKRIVNAEYPYWPYTLKRHMEEL